MKEPFEAYLAYIQDVDSPAPPAPPLAIRYVLVDLCRPRSDGSPGPFFDDITNLWPQHTVADLIRILEVEYEHGVSQLYPDAYKPVEEEEEGADRDTPMRETGETAAGPALAFPKQFLTWATAAISGGKLSPQALYTWYDILQQLTLYLHRLNGGMCRTWAHPPEATTAEAPGGASTTTTTRGATESEIALAKTFLPACNTLFRHLVLWCQRSVRFPMPSGSADVGPRSHRPHGPTGARGSGHASAAMVSPTMPAGAASVTALTLSVLREFEERLTSLLTDWHAHTRCPHAKPGLDAPTCIISESSSYLYLDLIELVALHGRPAARHNALYTLWLDCNPARSGADEDPDPMFPLTLVAERLEVPRVPHSSFLLQTHLLAQLLSACEVLNTGSTANTLGQLLHDLDSRPDLLGSAYRPFVDRLLTLVVLSRSPTAQKGFFARALACDLRAACLASVTRLVRLAERALTVSLDPLADLCVPVPSRRLQAEVPLALKLYRLIYQCVIDEPGFRASLAGQTFALRTFLVYLREQILHTTVVTPAGETPRLCFRAQLRRLLRDLLLYLCRTTPTFTQLVDAALCLWFTPRTYQRSLQTALDKVTADDPADASFGLAVGRQATEGERGLEGGTWGSAAGLPGWLVDLLLPDYKPSTLGTAARGRSDQAPPAPAGGGPGRFRDNKRKRDRRPEPHEASFRRGKNQNDPPSLFGSTDTNVPAPPSGTLLAYWDIVHAGSIVSPLTQQASQAPLYYDPTSKLTRARTVSAAVTAAATGPMPSSQVGLTNAHSVLEDGMLLGPAQFETTASRSTTDGAPILGTSVASTTVDARLVDFFTLAVALPTDASDRRDRMYTITRAVLHQFQPLLYQGPVSRYEEHLPRPIPFLRDVRLLNRCRQQPVGIALLLLTVDHPGCILEAGPLITSLLASLTGFFNLQHTKLATTFTAELDLVRALTTYLIRARLIYHPLDLLDPLYAHLTAGDLSRLLYGCVWPVYLRRMAQLHHVHNGGVDDTRYTRPSAMMTANALTSPMTAVTIAVSDPPPLSLNPPSPTASIDNSKAGEKETTVSVPASGHWAAYLRSLPGAREENALCTEEEVDEMREVVYAVLRRNLPATAPYFPMFL
ncbi:hypothetical protein IWQ60_008102 [Tieghemiomyces parasiticus]|uniref:Uncharacterized protein n=1 Tax=Tieghemiomyces parasiticus TaxID=78921 RepID=A0A9W7ZTS0_9FUNG|nr:hypothetical protein IWQ60_008102 [Tieghemiomyces parasiticus]